MTTGSTPRSTRSTSTRRSPAASSFSGGDGDGVPAGPELPFAPIDLPPGAIFARIVDKCGDRKYWETWARDDVADIFTRLVHRIENLLAASGNETLREWFGAFHEELKVSINASIDEVARLHSSNVRWDAAMKDNLRRRKGVTFSASKVQKTRYRPFVKQHCYVDYVLVNRKHQMDSIFPIPGGENRAICVPGVGSTRPFSALMVDTMPDLHCRCLILKQGVVAGRRPAPATGHEGLVVSRRI